MIFDVGVRENPKKAAYYRVHDRDLSVFVRKAQDDKYYVFSVRPLFRKREQVKEENTHTIPGTKLVFDEQYEGDRVFRKDIDSRLIKTESSHNDYDGF
jgi:hypothetical protein